MLCQFCKFYVHKRCSDIRSGLKLDDEIKCRNSANKETETKEESTGIEINGHSFEVVYEFCCLNDTVGNRRVSAFESVLTKTRN